MLQTLKGAVLALVIMLTFGGVARADDVTFSGTVTYPERMALPANASLVVTLVNLADQKSITGAQAALGGRASSPLQFTLNVRSNVLAPNRSYGLVAEIWSAGYVIFTSGQPVSVDPKSPTGLVIPVQFSPPPHEAPEQISPPVEAPNPLLEVVWTVTSLGGKPVLPLTKPTLSIAADHRAGGNGSCNSYFTEASFEEPPLTFGPIAGTRMACPPAIMAQEAAFFAALSATVGYELNGDRLTLFDAKGGALVKLARAK